jgi:streptogrisin D
VLAAAGGLVAALLAAAPGAQASTDLPPLAKPVAKPVPAPDFAKVAAAEMGVSEQVAARRLAAQSTQVKTADRLVRRLGSRAGGAYFDAAGSLVVQVTDARSVAAVRAAGAKAQVVTYSAARLRSVKAALDRHAGAAGTSWAVDTKANKVVVTVAANADKAKAAGVLATARRFGGAVRVDRSAASMALASPLLGGYPIYLSTGGRCSAGFNVTNGAAQYLLTAGHCTASFPFWYNYDNSNIGPTVGSNFPGSDFGIIHDQYATPYPGVYLYDGTYMPMYYTAYSYPGLYVCKSGSTTGVTCGTVLNTNVTVNYGNGQVVYGLDEVNVCVEPGDSGGSLFTGNTALGITSGSLLSGGRCLGGSAARGYFQPVIPAMNYYGVGLI